MSSWIKTWQFSEWSSQQIHRNFDLLRLPSMFNKRHDVGFFCFLFCQVYIRTYAKEFCIKRISGRLSDGWHLDLTQLKRAWLVGKKWSSAESCASLWKKLECSSSFIKAVGKSCHFCFIASMKWKKKSFEKQSFILFGRYGQVLPPDFPDVLYVITWCNSLFKEAVIMFLSTYILHILEWRSSPVWTFPFSGPLAQEGQEYQDSEHIIAILL